MSYLHKANKNLFACSLDYYKAAVKEIESSISNAHYFLFSDDHEWLKSSFQWLPHKTIVSSSSALDDFYLMQQAKHHIIANSTFSWWAAWLAYHSQQKVIAPFHWFRVKDKDTKRPYTQKLDPTLKRILDENWPTC